MLFMPRPLQGAGAEGRGLLSEAPLRAEDSQNFIIFGMVPDSSPGPARTLSDAKKIFSYA
jgi:hypothetical protein